MEELKNELLKDEYWESAYNRLVNKQGFSSNDKDLLWEVKELYKEDIVDKLMSGNYEWDIPKRVEIAKSGSNKKRIVYMYNTIDRYILGILYRAVSNYYKDKVCDSCFSYKKGKSIGNAINYIFEKRDEELRYGVKIDIHAYFNSVSKEKVIDMINELFSGGIKTSIEKLMLDNRVYWNNEIIDEWKALIPGCAFSSFLANYCLRECDQYFEDVNKVYARYSDDIIILDETKEELQKDLDVILGIIHKYGLTINEQKYKWFETDDSIEFLGLKIENNKIDISNHAKQKIKRQIHRWCRKGRIEIENEHKSFEHVASKIMRQLNNKNFKCYINHEETFGWCAYSFPRITTVESLKEIDEYTKNTLRALKTGKHNKANYSKMTEEEFKSIGWVSLVQLYYLYKKDYDYYCEVIELL